MTKDDRLYGKFTLDFPDSEKIAPLSDGAFRTLVEMTLHSRRLLTDGFIAEGVARKKWRMKAIAELTKNDAERPSLIKVDGGYQLHDYAEHQDTKVEVEARRARNAANGRRGGLAKHRASHSPSKVPSDSVSDSLSENLAVVETETETLSSTKRDAAKRGTRVPRSFAITDELREWAKVEVPLVNLDAKLSEWIDYWASVPGDRGVKLDWIATWRNGMRKQQEFAIRDGVPSKKPVDWMNP